MIIMGIDPGFASVGWAIADVTSSAVVPIAMGVIRTDKFKKPKKGTTKKLKIAVTDTEKFIEMLKTTFRGELPSASEDNLVRAVYVAAQLHGLILSFKPSALCVEAMSFPRNASNAAKMALSWGILACLSENNGFPVFQVSPKALKEAVSLNPGATKEEVQAAIHAQLGDVTHLVKGIPKGQHEHPYDALGAVLGCAKKHAAFQKFIT